MNQRYRVSYHLYIDNHGVIELISKTYGQVILFSTTTIEYSQIFGFTGGILFHQSQPIPSLSTIVTVCSCILGYISYQSDNLWITNDLMVIVRLIIRHGKISLPNSLTLFVTEFKRPFSRIFGHEMGMIWKWAVHSLRCPVLYQMTTNMALAKEKVYASRDY